MGEKVYFSDRYPYIAEALKIMRENTIKKVLEEKVIAIVRGVDPEACLKVAAALYEGGIRFMEVTFNQKDPSSFKDTAAVISSLSKAYEGKMLIGAGTVTTPLLVDLAVEAGAKYIISPDTNEDVIRRTRELGAVSMPGALTPTEVLIAHRAGADFVKLFPAGNLGASYVKALCAPISHVRMLAVGGVNEENAADFMKAGAVGVGVGGDLANKKWIDAGEFYKITEAARRLVESVNS